MVPTEIKARDISPPEAFAKIYQEHGQAIYYFALRILGDAGQAEDVTQDVFLKAYQKLETFRGEATLRTWLYRITLNHCRNLLNSWHYRHIRSGAEEVLQYTMAQVPHPLELLESKELGARIQQTLNQLPEEYRLLLLLSADEELSYQEIASLTAQSTDAVRGKLYRARKAFILTYQALPTEP